MKKKAIISGIGLVFCGMMFAQAQERVIQPTTNPDESVAVDYDLKLYSSQEEALLAEHTRNPEKPATPDSDAKQEAEGTSVNENVPAPSKPETPNTDPKLVNGYDLNLSPEKAPELISSEPLITSKDIDANTGLEKVKTEGTILNYREITGPPSQEIPAPQGKIINYRDLKGPDDQPLEKPTVR